MSQRRLADGQTVTVEDNKIKVPRAPEELDIQILTSRKTHLLIQIEAGKNAERQLVKINELLSILNPSA